MNAALLISAQRASDLSEQPLAQTGPETQRAVRGQGRAVHFNRMLTMGPSIGAGAMGHTHRHYSMVQTGAVAPARTWKIEGRCA